MSVPQDNLEASIASQHGLAVNQRNRSYRNGAALTYEQKVSIATKYLRAKQAALGTYGISKGINTSSENFAVHIILAVYSGYLLPYDVLVLDRAAIQLINKLLSNNSIKSI